MKKHYVSNKDESIRMFKSEWLEMFTKVHWSVPLILYVPLVSYLIYLSTQEILLTPLMGIGMFVTGIIMWSITEYVLHRFVFHYHPTSELGKKIHFTVHGVHHDYPNDSKRLVMPPGASIPLAFLFYYSFKAILPMYLLFPYFAGFVFGYLCYDMLHYAVHHVDMKGKLWTTLKTHHLKHHFKDPDKGYGVSSPIWDIVAGSNFTKGNAKHIKKKSVESKSA